MSKRLTVLISGHGSNLQALIDACTAGELEAEIGLVVSSTAEAYGLERAHRHGIPGEVLPWSSYRAAGKPRQAYDLDLARLVAASHPNLIVLAGWMRILTRDFLDHFPGKVINLHPALPGTFPGRHAISRAYRAWQEGAIQETGVMVHAVPDENVDAGPAICTAVVPIQHGDSLSDLERRVHATEHALLVAAVQKMLAEPTPERPVAQDEGAPDV